MKSARMSFFLIILLNALCGAVYAEKSYLSFVPEEFQQGDPTNNKELAWTTIPGYKYELQASSNLQYWFSVSGVPTQAATLAERKVIDLPDDRLYYRVRMLDEQPPEIVFRYPSDGAFGVRRFSPITIELADDTGINTNSLLLTVGAHGVFSVVSSELSYQTNTLTFDLGGDTALGMYETTVSVSLVAADMAGNVATNNWSFQMESDSEVATNLFVFGSPEAQRSGQTLVGPAATLAAKFNNGPVRMSGSSENWEIVYVPDDCIIISYNGIDAPSFEVGQYVANLAPANVREIFYRRIDSISDNPNTGSLILFTTEVDLPEILRDGSFTVGDENTYFLEMDENGNLVEAIELEARFDLPTIGADYTGDTIYSDEICNLWLEEGRFLFYPYLKVSLDVNWVDGVKRFEAQAAGDLDIACVPRFQIGGSYSTNVSHELWSWGHWIWTTAGPVPVGVELAASVTAEASFEVAAEADMKTGFRQTGNMGMAGRYVKGADPAVTWDRWVEIDPLEEVPFTYTLHGEGLAVVKLVPQIDVRVYGAAGLYVNVDPRLELSGSATMTDGMLTEGDWLLGAYADLNAGLSVIGFEPGELPGLPPCRLFTYEWGNHYRYNPPPPEPPEITRQPRSQSVQEGDDVVFSVTAEADSSISYQWFKDNRYVPGKTDRKLRLYDVNESYVGDYYVRVSANGESVNSGSAYLQVVEGQSGIIPAGMVLIPAGTFQMGDTFGDSYSGELPLHNVYVSAFYMDKYEVSKNFWDEVASWADDHGYDISPGDGSGKSGNHPVYDVNWYECVKWCNARSQMEGITPCYTVGGSTYKTGERNPACNWNANGYRLPTEAEWEKAARGGLSGRRFSWGNTIQHSRANYYSSPYYSYDTSSTRGYNPDYDDGGYPYTSPVGSYPATGYGLYDMAGNVWEWCHDWRGGSYYSTSPGTDPTGPASGTNRVLRGGCWSHSAYGCRVANRYDISPNYSDNFYGLRCVR